MSRISLEKIKNDKISISGGKMHAYLLIIHEYTNVLHTLLRCIDDVRNDIYIHVDANCKGFEKEKCEADVSKSVIYWCPNVKVAWGGYSLIESEIQLLKAATQKSYEYYHLLSGQDLPLKNQDDIHHFFDLNKGKEFVRFQAAKFAFQDRVRYYHLFQELLPRKPKTVLQKVACRLNCAFLWIQKECHFERNKKIHFQKGTQWFSITDELARYVLSQEAWIRKIFKFTYCCDEVFLQTLILNSSFLNKLYITDMNNDIKANMRFIDWDRGKPYIFHMEDFTLLINSGCLFARKFSSDVDDDIVEKIGEVCRRH